MLKLWFIYKTKIFNLIIIKKIEYNVCIKSNLIKFPGKIINIDTTKFIQIS